MHWVLSKNIFDEQAYERLIQALTSQGIPYSEHKVVPFAGTIEPDVPDNLHGGNCIVFGPYSMRKTSKAKGWYPGTFDVEQEDFNVQMIRWGHHMLNHDSRVVRFADADWHNKDQPMFMRPIKDSKVFAGGLMDHQALKEWQEKVVDLKHDYGDNLTADTMVQIARPKRLIAEYRCWIVRGQIVTMSQYKRDGKLAVVNADSFMYDRVREYAAARAFWWHAHDAYCLDVCELHPDEFEHFDEPFAVVEIGTINACGFYAADMQRLVHALQKNFSRSA